MPRPMVETLTIGNLGRSNRASANLSRFARVRDWGRDKPLLQLGG